MLFNSLSFCIFLPCVFVLYWSLARRLRLQNVFIVAASYMFYGWWDWRFLVLIAITSALSYVIGLIELRRWDAAPSRALLVVSVVVNLGILCVFKYFNFFVDSLERIASVAGFKFDAPLLTVILPVGISFYTFQALSYTIDVYRRKVRPTGDAAAFFAFISFFPQLVAGPIERASNLLPQFLTCRNFSYPDAVSGCRQMLWGFFKKMIVADNCAIVANQLLGGDAAFNGLAAWIGMIMFSVQIYCDFSGYSDIAIGCSKLFGVKLMRNFACPYFARDIAEFWRRWHISLTTWFRDYVYIPLGGSKCGAWRGVRNVFIIFLLSGLWHGANWTFVCWGAFHAMLFLPLFVFGLNRRYIQDENEGGGSMGCKGWIQIALTVFFVVVGWTFFRAQTFKESIVWMSNMFNPLTYASVKELPREFFVSILFSCVMFGIEWLNRREPFGFSLLPNNVVLRRGLYYIIIALIIIFTPGSETFVYFQF